MRKYKLGKQKKFLMLTGILSIILLMSTSMAAAAISRSVADSITSESAESSDVSASLTSDSAETVDDLATPSVDLLSDSAVAKSDPSQLSNKAPVADFSFSPLNPLAGTIVVFDGSASYDPDGRIVSYYWSYTAGSSFPVFIANSNEPICHHAFDDPGNYLVSLKVTDNKGATDIMNKLVKVPYAPSVTSEAEVDQSASTELTATSENKVASNNAQSVQTQQQTSPSQQLFNRILNTRSPLGNSQAFALITFRKGSSNATIDDITYIGNKATMELTINEGVMNFRFLGGSATVSAGEQVTIGMFRGIFWKEPKNSQSVQPSELFIVGMIGLGWYSA